MTRKVADAEMSCG
jgi:hypothetical protein